MIVKLTLGSKRISVITDDGINIKAIDFGGVMLNVNDVVVRDFISILKASNHQKRQLRASFLSNQLERVM